MSDFYNASGVPANKAALTSAPIRSEFTAIAAAFAKLPNFAGAAGQIWRNNAGGTGVESVTLAVLMTGLTNLVIAGTLTGVTDLTTSGNTILGDAIGDTLNVANGTLVVGSQNVGVNTTPDVRFHVGGAAPVISFAGTSGTSTLLSGNKDGAGAAGPNIQRWTNGAAQWGRGNSFTGVGGVYTQYMQLDATGLAIGANAPGVKLDVQGGAAPNIAAIRGSAEAGSALLYTENQNASAAQWYVGHSGIDVDTGNLRAGALKFYANGAERMRISSTGLVGIGVTPTVKLHVKSANDMLRIETTTARGSGGAIFTVYDPTGLKAQIGYPAASDQFFISQELASDLLLRTNGTERMRIDSAGLVGIGGTAIGQFDVIGAAATTMRVRSTAASNAQFNLQNGTSGTASTDGFALICSAPDAYVWNYESGNLLFGTNNIERVRINANGQSTFGGAIGTYWGAYQFDGTSFNGFQINDTAAGGAPTMFSVVKNGTTFFAISGAGLITDGTNELGFKGLPPASVTTGAFAASDRGKCVYATGGVTVPNATMSQGDVVTINNTTAAAITITASIATLRFAGTTLTGNRTLGGYGMCTLVFESGTVAKVSGNIT